jgi:hypothetical protein
MANKKRRRWHKLPGPLQSLIEELAHDNPTWTPSQIHKELTELGDDKRPKYPEIAKYDVPDPRTVQSIVKLNRPPDPSGPWEHTHSPGEDVVPVLEVIKHLRETSEAYWPTQAEAEHIVWVKRTAPTMPAALVWQVARRYMVYEARQVQPMRLAWFLAFRPWESAENKDAYFAAVPPDERVIYPVEASGQIQGGAGLQAVANVSKGRGPGKQTPTAAATK